MADELLRLIDSLHMEKGIDRNVLFESLEAALISAARRTYPDIEELRVRIDRQSGIPILLDGDRPLSQLDPGSFCRIAAQTAKQVMIQRLREAESDAVFEEFQSRTGKLLHGAIQRLEHGNVILNIGKADAILPRQEQIPSETYRPGERLRCFVLSVRKKGNKVLITLSRTHPDLVRQLFEMEVPEISDRLVEIRGLVREPGYRSKIAVHSSDNRIDPVGACVGIGGNRIRNIVEELGGERIDIVHWSADPEQYIRKALNPAEIESIEFDRYHQRARVVVADDQLSLAIGKKGQNVRLSSKLTGWALDIMTIDEHSAWRERGRAEIAALPDIKPAQIDNLLMQGFESYRDIVELGRETLASAKGVEPQQVSAFFEAALEGHRARLEEKNNKNQK